MRPGGLILLDNVLWAARWPTRPTTRQTEALRALNAKLHRDERIGLSLLPLGDGLTGAPAPDLRSAAPAGARLVDQMLEPGLFDRAGDQLAADHERGRALDAKPCASA